MALNKGVFCVSFDTELMWGRHDKDYWKSFIPRARRTRSTIKQIVSFLETRKVGVTWAVVGHLFLKNCTKEGGIVHSQIKRPHYNWHQKDWFSNDPATDIVKNPEWYGEDIIDLLKQTKYQEVGSHSFSHLIFGDKGCTTESAKTDLEACISEGKKANIKLNSFVFPRNKIGYLGLLKQLGFTSFRGNPEDYKEGKSFIEKLILATELFLPTSPPVSVPFRQSGLLNIPASMYYPSGRGSRKYIPKRIRFLKAKKGIDRAISEKKIFHLWTHPIDFAEDREKLLSDFFDIISYAVMMRDKGILEIQTMNNISKNFK